MRNLFICLLLCPATLLAQEIQDTILLKDIVVVDQRINNQQVSFVQSFNDSVLGSERPSLTSFLNARTPIYFKENGYGMTSSVSFRGTTASQTSVLWNGININSAFLGQTDFNTVSTRNYDHIYVKPGGGSVIYGSGAIGGSIHLNNQLLFNKGWHTDVNASYGSYDTKNIALKIGNSKEKFTWNFNTDYIDSNNDFEISDIDYTNINGQFWNYGINANMAYQFNDNNVFSTFLQHQKDERHFSLNRPSETPTKYQNNNIRGLFQWKNQFRNLRSFVRLAYLQEEFKYFTNVEEDYATRGENKSMVFKYDGNLTLNKLMNLSLLAEFTNQNAKGENTGINKVRQNKGNMALLWSHQLTPTLNYELGIRKVFHQDYKSPLLYSMGLKFVPINNYVASLNVSKNFRAPTLNDLYWVPGGNLDLNAESSTQVEVSQQYQWNKNKIGLNLYWNKIEDLISWKPSAMGYWQPENVDEVDIKGLEIYTHLYKKLGSHVLSFNSNYAYTISKNTKTDLQLIYVPYHKLNGYMAYSYKKLNAFIEGIFVGSVYTQSDNNNQLDSYLVLNTGIGYYFTKQIKLGVNLYNITNTQYQVVLNRQMPPLNYMITFNLKI